MILGIGPFRVLEIASTDWRFENLQFTSPFNSKKGNQRLVREATEIIVFIDDLFYQRGKSIGTKVEIRNNRTKISKAYIWTSYPHRLIDADKDRIFNYVSTQLLPTVEEYVNN